MNKCKLYFIMLTVFLLTGCEQDGMIFTTDDKNDGLISETEETEISPNGETDTGLSEEELIYVYVCGHVVNPGVYCLDASARICDALDMAGGISEDGNPVALNQASKMTDGMTLYVPSFDEDTDVSASETTEDGLININTADKETLMNIPGIGESKADAIIAYRNENGEFKRIEDLMNISGIKEGVFNKMKQYIKVSG